MSPFRESSIDPTQIFFLPPEHHYGVTSELDIDIETCSECGGDVKIIASIEDPMVIRKILAHLDDNAPSATTALLLAI
jgi:hypothetical protein